MINLLKLEFYKLKQQKTYRILLLVVIAISAFSAFSEVMYVASGDAIYGKEAFIKASQDLFMLFSAGIFAGFFIGSDFTNRSISAMIAHGHSRRAVILAKAIVYLLASSIMILLYPITASLVHTYAFGWGEPFTPAAVLFLLRAALLSTLLNAGAASIFVLFGFLCQDTAKTICCSLAFPVALVLVNSTLGSMLPLLQKAISFTPMAQLKYIALTPLPAAVLVGMLTSAGVAALIALIVTDKLFAKADIK